VICVLTFKRVHYLNNKLLFMYIFLSKVSCLFGTEVEGLCFRKFA